MDRTKIRRILAAPLVLLAAASVGMADAGPKHERNGSFVALSYNVAGLPDAISGSEPATNSPLISPLLNDYDLVLLQENWQDTLHDEREAGLVGDEVPPIMYHHLVVRDATHPFRSIPAPHPNGVSPERFPTGPPTLSDGLNRLSRFPFDAVVRVTWRSCHGELAKEGAEAIIDPVDDALGNPLPGDVRREVDGGASDCGAEKGFSVSTIELAPGVEVDVYNLHADAGSSERDQVARADNFAQLADHIIVHSAGRAVILGGDTNLKVDREDRPLDTQAWDDFRARTGLADVCDVLDCGADSVEIDKFAFRDGTNLKIIPQKHRFERDVFVRSDGEPLSDHDALAVRFKWVVTGRR